MKLTNFPVEENQPVKFKLTGFPQDELVKDAVERFYYLKPDANKSFVILNDFNEQIFSGTVNEQRKVGSLNPLSRAKDSFSDKDYQK